VSSKKLAKFLFSHEEGFPPLTPFDVRQGKSLDISGNVWSEGMKIRRVERLSIILVKPYE
jgi:hypothetical protein